MTQNESIEFACPNCNMGLKVQVQFAGVTGPCPQCQAEITAPHHASAGQSALVQGGPAPPPQSQLPPRSQGNPQTPPDQQEIPPPERPGGSQPHRQPVSPPPQPKPQVTTQATKPATPPTQTGRKKMWTKIVFPALILALVALVVYLILNFMGILDFNDDPKNSAVTSITTVAGALG